MRGAGVSSDYPNRSLRRLGLDPLAATVGGLVALAVIVLTWLALSGPPTRTVADTTAVVVALSQSGQETASRELPPKASTDAESTPDPAASNSGMEETAPPAAPEPPMPQARAEPSTGAAVPKPPVGPPPARQTTTPTTPPQHDGPPAPAEEEEAAFTPPPELPNPPDPSKDVVTAAEQPGSARSPAPTDDHSVALAQEMPAAKPSAQQPAMATEAEPAPVQSSALSGATRGLAAPEPDPDLLELSRFGPLPRISSSGHKPWRAYARPFDTSDKRPRIGIIVSQLGFSSAATESAIWQLPAAITLSFAPNARGLGNWIGLARAAGHEVLIEVPMEPVDFPANDPGPDTLLTSLTAEENRARLRTLLGRVSGYVGVVNQMGSRFTTSEPHLRPVLTELRDRGLMFVDSRSSLHSVAARTATEMRLPRAVNNRFIDADVSRTAIDSRLAELERIARTSGHAVGIGQPHPVTLERLRIWTRKIELRGFALAPISALANAQPDHAR
jgi:hypothetical protein